MSATEVIELIKKLPPSERREVEEFIAGSKSDGSSVQIASPERFESAVGEVFEKYDHLLRKLAQ